MATKTPRAKLNLETLEERANPSSFVDANGDLVINGTPNNDTVTIRQVGSWIKVVDNGVNAWYQQSQVWGGDIHFWGGNGNDYVNNYVGSLRLNAFGQHGNDTLIGDAANDHLHGGEGTDYLYGYGGDDHLEGRKGTDYLYGMSGNDNLDGGDDGVRDYLNGGSGADRFQREMYRFLWFWRNRDYPLDFSAAQGDSFYG